MWTVSPTRNLLVLPLALPNIDLSKWPSGPMFGDIPGWMVAWSDRNFLWFPSTLI